MQVLQRLYEKIKTLKSNPEISSIISNTGWLMVERIVQLITGVLISIWVTRYLGPERYGIYSYALSFSVIFTAFASFGIDSIVIRDLVKFEKKKNDLMGTAFAIKLIGGVLSLIVATIVLFFVNIEFETKIFVAIIVGSTIIKSFNVIDNFFQSRVESKFIVKTNTTALILSHCIKIILVLTEGPLIGFVLILLFDSTIRSLGYLFFYKKNNFLISEWKFNKKLAKSLLLESWPLVLSGIAISTAMRIDQIMLKSYLPANELGFYAVGVRLAELFSFLPMMIGQSIYPKIVKLDFKANKKKISQLIRYVFYFLCLMSLAVTLCANIGVDLLYGSKFISSTPVLQILIWTIPITYLGIITNKLLMVQGHQKVIFIKQLALMITNISFNLYFIPYHGIVGAALATLLADIVINLFFDIIFNKARWIFYIKMRAIFLIQYKK